MSINPIVRYRSRVYILLFGNVQLCPNPMQLYATLDSEDMIERVKAGIYTLTLTPIDGLILCCVSKGDSYHAVEKMKKMTMKMREQSDYLATLLKGKGVPGIDQKTFIEECIEYAFPVS